jgi:hypothetical protein
MRDIGIDIRDKGIFQRLKTVPEGRRLLFGQLDFDDGLDLSGISQPLGILTLAILSLPGIGLPFRY